MREGRLEIAVLIRMHGAELVHARGHRRIEPELARRGDDAIDLGDERRGLGGGAARGRVVARRELAAARGGVVTRRPPEELAVARGRAGYSRLAGRCQESECAKQPEIKYYCYSRNSRYHSCI